jgi:hypothetical protein
MANSLADFQSFLEDRLTALDPTIDLSSGSAAQVQVIGPILTYLGTDPLETDLLDFITDRLSQELPDLYNGDPGVINDQLIKPASIILSPLKRALNVVRINQSLENPTLLSDDAADALVANIGGVRAPGLYSQGPCRVWFPSPQNVSVDGTTRFYTSGNLNFYPSTPQSITADQMVFQADGTLYYVDFDLIAESTGNQYNVPAGVDGIIGVVGLFGVAKVGNLVDMAGGSPSVDTPTLIQDAVQGLSEKSLNSRRGALARLLLDVFQSSMRALVVVGAGDVEMQRDILVAAAPGHMYLQGQVGLYDQVAFFEASVVDGDGSRDPQPGDTLYVYLNAASYPTVPQSQRCVKLSVLSVLAGQGGGMTATAPYQAAWLLQWSGSLPAGVTFTSAVLLGGVSKTPEITISSIPDTGAVDLTVASGSTHVFGHTDYYVRPILRPVSTLALSSLKDGTQAPAPVGVLPLEGTTLMSSSTHSVSDPNIASFVTAGVTAGAILVLETGSDTGVYNVLAVTASNLYLDTTLGHSEMALRYRVLNEISLNPFNPKFYKFPFGPGSAPSDLSTVIGSPVLRFSTVNLAAYGVVAGDTVNILSGPDEGEHTITGFNASGSGTSLNVSAPLASTTGALSYEVYSVQTGLTLPLVRIKEIQLLNSSQQSIGVDVPPADPIAVVPTSDFTSATILGTSNAASGYVLPNLAGILNTAEGTSGNIPGTGSPSATNDQRYSLGFDTPNGVYKAQEFPWPASSEFDYRSDTSSNCSWFLALPEQSVSGVLNVPPITPQPGNALTLQGGLNAGSYLIKQAVSFRYVDANSNSCLAYFIQIYGTFPIDVIGSLLNFLQETNTIASGPLITADVLDTSGQSGTVGTEIQGTHLNVEFSTGSGWSSLWSGHVITTPNNSALSVLAAEFNAVSSFRSANLVALVVGTELRLISTSNVANYQIRIASSSTAINGVTAGTLAYTSNQVPAGVVPWNLYNALFNSLGTLLNAAMAGLGVTAPPSATTLQAMVVAAATTGYDWGEPARGVLRTYFEAPVRAVMETANSLTPTLFNYVTPSGEQVFFRPDPNQYPEQEFVPSWLVTETDPKDYPRDMTTSASSATVGFTGTEPSMFVAGVEANDILAIHEEVVPAGYSGPIGSGYGAVSVQTTAGSNVLQVPSSGGTPFTNVGAVDSGLIAITEGPDAGVYRVLSVLSSTQLEVDSTMTASTMQILSQGSAGAFVASGAATATLSQTGIGTGVQAGQYVTVCGTTLASKYFGSFPITLVATNEITFTLPATLTLSASNVQWMITAAPTTPPTATGNSTVCLATHPVRIYNNQETRYSITNVPTSGGSSLTVNANVNNGSGQPYRIVRENVRWISPTELSNNPFGPYCFIDTQVVSLSPGPEANISSASYLTLVAGTLVSEGYRHVVADSTLSYSLKETGTLQLPLSILPVGAADSPTNYISLYGSPLQFLYETASLVADVDAYINSSEDRILSANFLTRHFLPMYLSYEATYSGGSPPSTIAADIFNYLDTLPSQTAAEVSKIEKIIDADGGDPVTPTSLLGLVHDWNRQRWLEISQDFLGGTSTLVPYYGTPRVAYACPGADASGQDPLPVGERIVLTQQ